MNTDMWGQPVAGEPASVMTWDKAWGDFTHFRGDPAAVLETACQNDDTFVMGPVFVATYTVLGGSPFDLPGLLVQLERARTRSRNAPDRETGHVEALRLLATGEFTRAAERWDQVAAAERDFAATRFAHDTYLHVGDRDRRLVSSRDAMKQWSSGPGSNFVAGQYAFALEEAGHYEEAEEVGLQALDVDPDDLWARHALAHVYESLDDSEATIKLLVPSADRWSEQDLLATHIWWHLALRLLAMGEIDSALGTFDERLPDATRPFRLCDSVSLLWRSELAGFDVGDRWDALADCWDTLVERHTCAFLDLHASLCFASRPDHRGSNRWFDGLANRQGGTSGNDQIFQDVVKPLVAAMRLFVRGESTEFLSILDQVGSSSSRIGGSEAQRDLITLTRQAAE